MKRTLKIKINPPKDEFLELLLICNSIFNRYTKWSRKAKTYSKSKAHTELYAFLRTKFPQINSALIQTVRDTALEAVKATKFKRKIKKKKYSSLRYDRRTLTLRGQQITLTGLSKRHKEILSIPDYYKEIFSSWVCKSGTLSYINGQFYINLIFETDSPKEVKGEVVGIDRGLYNLVTLSDGTNMSGSAIRNVQRKYLYNRKKLQAKGTPSAKRLLKKISGKEKRFNRDVNHVITKKLSHFPYSVFVLEDLSSIRTQRRGKKMNKWISSWPFFQFEQFLTYKAEALGKKVEYVDAHYTSRKCSRCGNRSRHNRYKSRFCCSVCGYTNHADINAALNIRDNYILSTTEKSVEQGPVNSPYESPGVALSNAHAR
jgi:transposase, IS605 OrfB family, central region